MHPPGPRKASLTSKDTEGEISIPTNAPAQRRYRIQSNPTRPLSLHARTRDHFTEMVEIQGEGG